MYYRFFPVHWDPLSARTIGDGWYLCKPHRFDVSNILLQHECHATSIRRGRETIEGRRGRGWRERESE